MCTLAALIEANTVLETLDLANNMLGQRNDALVKTGLSLLDADPAAEPAQERKRRREEAREQAE